MRDTIDALRDSDLAFLDAIRDGTSMREAARRLNYSPAWAKKRARQIKDRLGVDTIEEALAMSEGASDGVGKADFDKLREPPLYGID